MTNMPPHDPEIKSPKAILRIGTSAWIKQGRPRDRLVELTNLYTTAGARLPDENVSLYLAALAQDAEFAMPPACRAYLDANITSSDPDDELLHESGEAEIVKEGDEQIEEAAVEIPFAVPDTGKSPLHIAALEYAARGWPVFPCQPDAKAPATEHGHKDATTDTAQINEWWEQNPNYNVALCPESCGLAVIEADTYKEGCGIADLKLPETYEVQSPRGGSHYYFEGSLPPTVGKLAEHVDTRGKNSYVLVPPSVVNGKEYKVRANRNIAPLPQSVADRLAPKGEAHTAAPDVELDEPQNISRARTRIKDFIARGVVAVAGRGGNNTTYKVSAELSRDFGLTQDTALELFREWNAHCVPPWSDEELQTFIRNSSEYGQNEVGAYAVKPASETFGPLPPKTDTAVPKDVKPDSPRNPYAPMDLRAVIKRPPATYWDDTELLVKVPEGCTILAFGPKGIQKTGVFLRAHILTVFKDPTAIVYYFAGEAPEDLVAARLIPILKSLEADGLRVTFEDLLATGRFFIARKAPVLMSDGEMELVFAELNKHRPNLIVIDTATRALPGQRLDQETMTTAHSRCDAMRERYHAAVTLLHHSGKDIERGAKGDSSLEHNSDVVLELSLPQTGVTTVTRLHNRFGSSGHKASFKWQYFPHPYEPYSKDPRKSVPVPVPMSAKETAAIPTAANLEKLAYRGVSEQALTVLRKLKITKPFDQFYPTPWLAKDIANLTYNAPAQMTEAAQAEFDAMVAKIIKKLDNGAGTEKKPGPLGRMIVYRLPKGAKPNSSRTVRSWFCPPDKLEDQMPTETMNLNPDF